MKLRLGTRGSHLARTQSQVVVRALEALGHEPELVIIRTSGDASAAPSFGSIGPQGVFVREIEQALLDARVDLAVHSCKDLTTTTPAELALPAIPERGDPADLLIMRPAVAAADAGVLPVASQARIGTSSARRQAWIRGLRPDLRVEPLRGNVPTRIARLIDGQYDAIVLAAAGLERLKASPLSDAPELPLDRVTVVRLDPDQFVPAPAQGALALQCRARDQEIVELLAGLNHPASQRAVAAERELLARAEGGCGQAFGAHCVRRDGGWRLSLMLEIDGALGMRSLAGADPDALVDQIWRQVEGP